MKNALLSIAFLFAFTYIQGQTIDKLNLQHSFFEPQEIIKVKEGHYFIDFGKAFFGTVEITAQESQTDSLIIHLGEKLESIHKIDQKPGATIRYRKSILPGLNTNVPVSVTMQPFKRNTTGAAIQLPDSVGAIIPFRYCEVENLKIPIKKIQFKQKALITNFMTMPAIFHLQTKSWILFGNYVNIL